MCVYIYIYLYIIRIIYVCRDLWWNSLSLNKCIELYTQIPEFSKTGWNLCKYTTRLDEKNWSKSTFLVSLCLRRVVSISLVTSWVCFFFTQNISGFSKKSMCWRKSQVHSDGELDGISLFVYNNRVLYVFSCKQLDHLPLIGYRYQLQLGLPEFSGKPEKEMRESGVGTPLHKASNFVNVWYPQSL